jgi:hypothetical protein
LILRPLTSSAQGRIRRNAVKLQLPDVVSQRSVDKTAGAIESLVQLAMTPLFVLAEFVTGQKTLVPGRKISPAKSRATAQDMDDFIRRKVDQQLFEGSLRALLIIEPKQLRMRERGLVSAFMSFLHPAGQSLAAKRNLLWKVGKQLRWWHYKNRLNNRQLILSSSEVGALYHFPNTVAVVIGEGERKQALIDLIVKFGLEKNIILLGYIENASEYLKASIAELHDNKGLSYFVSAMRSVCRERPNTVAVVIGEGERKQALIDLIVKFGLEKNIILLGYIENASEYLKAFNIFVLPSVKEGLPYVLLEAGYASLPVVATSAGGIPEIVEDMKSGILVQPKKSKELAHAISFMIEHSVGRKAYGTTLRERVIALFSMEKMITKTENLYQALGASSTK